MTTQEAPLTLSVAAAAKRLGIGERNCYRAIRAGRLPHLIFGHRIVVPISALESYLRDTYKPTDVEANAAK